MRDLFHHRRLAAENAQLIEMITGAQMLWPGLRTIVFAGEKGGSGKTPAAVGAARIWDRWRGEQITLLDPNPHGGTTRHRVVRPGVPQPAMRLSELGAHAAQPGRFDYLPALADYSEIVENTRIRLVTQDGVDSRRRQWMPAAEHGAARAVLARYSQLLLIDAGTGVDDDASRSAYAGADHLVWSVKADPASMQRAEDGLREVRRAGFGDLVARAVVLWTQSDPSMDQDALKQAGGLDFYRQHCATVVRLPYDKHLVSGRIDLDQLRPATLNAELKMAAAVTEQFGQPAASVLRHQRLARAVDAAREQHDEPAELAAKQALQTFEAISGQPPFTEIGPPQNNALATDRIGDDVMRQSW